MRVILTEWYLSNIDKVFEKIFEGVFFSEFANKNAAALLKMTSFTVTGRRFCLKFG